MFEFLSRISGAKTRAEDKRAASGQAKSDKAGAARPKYYQPERYYMRGPGPAWHARNPKSAEAARATVDENA
jgi:hypothetical protein